MKKTLALLALALCLLLLCSCKATSVLGNIADQLHEANTESAEAPASDGGAAEASAADAVEAPAGESEAVSDDNDIASSTDSGETAELPDEPAPSDFAAMSAEELVVDADGAPGKLPRITIDCAGASYINDDIEGSFRYLVDDPMCSLYYTVYKNGDILSVVVAQTFEGNNSYYTPYNLDLTTGRYLTGEDLLSRLGADRTVISDTELAIMAEEYEHMYGGLSEGDGAEFYAEQYARTTAPENAELNRVWLAFGGELTFVARIYSMAGAEFYEYPMSTGLYF